METHGEEQVAGSGLQRPETQSSLEKKGSLNPCPACNESRRFNLSVINFTSLSPDLCDRCKFVYDVVEAGIARGLFRVTGTTKQEITAGWTYESDHQLQKSTRKSSKRNRENGWSDLHWYVWNRSIGHPASRFELFVLPGKFDLHMLVFCIVSAFPLS